MAAEHNAKALTCVLYVSICSVWN